MNPAISPLERIPSLWRRLVRGYRKLRQEPDWASFAGPDWADRIMDVEVRDRFHAKQGRSIGRWSLRDSSGRSLVVYLKRHYELPRLHALLALFFPGRAWSPGLQEWMHLTWAREHGLPVPRAVAAGEWLNSGRKLQSFLAVEELTGMLPLHEAVPLAATRLNAGGFRAWKRSLAIEMARLTRLLHDQSVFHKDLYLCHFYIHESNALHPCPNWRNNVVVIDLHRLQRHPFSRLWWQVKDLGQLLYSSEIVGINARDRLAFWSAYTGNKPRRWLRALVRWKWNLYRQHNLKRKHKKVSSGDNR